MPARGAGWPARPSLTWLSGIRDWIAACLRHEVEHRRLFPWIAVAYGVGILLAFAADGPLSLWPPTVCAVGAIAFAVLGRASATRLAALVALGAVFCGFAAAVVRMRSVEAPVLQRLTIGRLEGFVESVEERARGGGRLVVRVASLGELAAGERPERVRITARSLSGIAPGNYLRAAVRLLPPPEAARPGGYDFARDAYFRGLGAVGSVSGQVGRIDPPPVAPDLALRLAAGIDAARNTLTARIANAVGGQAGAVSAALVTGKRGLIDDHTNDVLRAAGIYHVVSISGLHMVLAAGLFFAAARALLALSPALALGWPIKKIAAAIGMAGATAYCVFSGSEIATERSLAMILVMQGAILVDRPALSMRNLAVSALVVLTREPEALLGPSFQMSYAAVAGLIAMAEIARRLRPEIEPGDAVKRIGLWLAGLVLGTLATTLVATFATGPFGAFHFQNLQPYGLLGNAATLPLVSLAVMPAAVLGVVAYPFGLDGPVWATMGLATRAVLALSEWISGFPTSTIVVPAYGEGALLLLALAILLATLPSSPLRLVAVFPAAIGLACASAPERPDIYVARDGSGAAIRTAGGRLAMIGRVPAFTAEQWLRADGDSRKPDDPGLAAGVRCDPLGCTATLPDGRVVSHIADRRGFAQDCRRAAVIVSRQAAPVGCAATLVADAPMLRARGALTIAANPDGLAVESVRRPADRRPWLVRDRPPQTPPRAPARPAEAHDTRATPDPVPPDDVPDDALP